MNLLVLIKIWTAKRHLCLCLPIPPSSCVYGALVCVCVSSSPGVARGVLAQTGSSGGVTWAGAEKMGCFQ